MLFINMHLEGKTSKITKICIVFNLFIYSF